MAAPPPIIGEWYKQVGGEIFEVVATDDGDGTIEIQYFDGTVEEMDADAWAQSPFISCEPPEDYSGSMDMDREDFARDADAGPHKDWADPLDFLDLER